MWFEATSQTLPEVKNLLRCAMHLEYPHVIYEETKKSAILLPLVFLMWNLYAVQFKWIYMKKIWEPNYVVLYSVFKKSMNITSQANAVMQIMCIISSPETHIMSNLHFTGLNAVSVCNGSSIVKRNQIVRLYFGHGCNAICNLLICI